MKLKRYGYTGFLSLVWSLFVINRNARKTRQRTVIEITLPVNSNEPTATAKEQVYTHEDVIGVVKYLEGVLLGDIDLNDKRAFKVLGPFKDYLLRGQKTNPRESS